MIINGKEIQSPKGKIAISIQSYIEDEKGNVVYKNEPKIREMTVINNKYFNHNIEDVMGQRGLYYIYLEQLLESLITDIKKEKE